jgi:telomerase protein component 1
MVSHWRTARVLISSTFRDMHAERDHLVKVVFPELRERLLPHRIYFDDIDLRWGITEEESNKDKVLDLCLQQIDECRPFFIGILGERYGWVPNTPLSREAAKRFEKYGKTQLETGQSITELEILFGVLLLDPRMRERSFFYFRDPRFSNAAPVDRRKDVRHQFQEFPTQEEVQRLGYKQARREAAVRRLKLRRLKQRIRAGSELGYPVVENYQGRWDPEAFDRPTKTYGRLVDLNAFGRQLRDQLWAAIMVEFELPDQPADLSAANPASRLADLADDQARFVDSRLRVYVGRDDVQRELVAYALGNETKPSLVSGPSGSGKSAALARFVAESARAVPNAVVVAHFVGAGTRSTALVDVLKRLCNEFFERQLKTERLIRLAENTGTREDAEMQREAIEAEFAVPDEIAALATTWRRFLTLVPAEHRVIIVIDALNQLEEADRAQELWWLPDALPPHVKIIASSIVDPAAPEAEKDPVGKAFRSRPYHTIGVGGLTRDERAAIVRLVPSLSAKSLSEDQVHRLLKNPATANPLYLRVALEELRGFGSFEQLNDRIDALPHSEPADSAYQAAGFSPEAMRAAGDPLTALFVQVIERLEQEFDHTVVRSVLAWLAAARRGLSEGELQELLARSPGADNLFPVLRQLRPYLVDRAGLLGFFHDGLLRAVQCYYLDSETARHDAHDRLADYFNGQDGFLESVNAQRQRALRAPPTSRPANLRKVDELPWQRLEAGQWDALATLLLDLSFLEAKAEAGRVFDLAGDFSAALFAVPSEHSHRRRLVLLENAIRADLHFLARHPTCLFQCLWNRAWWYDRPDAFGYHQPREPGAAPGDPSREADGAMLSALVEEWRHQKEVQTPGFLWVRSLRPPRVRLAGPLRASIRAEWDILRGLATSSDDNLVVIWSMTFVGSQRVETTRAWDLRTGAESLSAREDDFPFHDPAVSPDAQYRLAGSDVFRQALYLRRISDGETIRRFDIFEGEITRECCFSPDGRRVAAAVCSEECGGSVSIWDATDGRLLRGLYSDRGVGAVALGPGGRLVAFATYDGMVEVREVDSGSLLARWPGHDDAIDAVAFSRGGDRILTGSQRDGTIRLWDFSVAVDDAQMSAHSDTILNLVFSSDGRRLVTASENSTTWLWDAADGAPVSCLHRSEFIVLEGGPARDALYADDRRVISLSDKGLQIWDATDGHPLREDAANDVMAYWFHKLAFSPDGQRVAIWTEDGYFQNVIDLQAAGRFTELQGLEAEVRCVRFSPDGRRLLAGCRDGTARIWSAADGALLTCLRDHEGAVTAVAFSADGGLGASASTDGRIRLWDLAQGRLVSSFSFLDALRRPRGLLSPVADEESGLSYRVIELAFSPEGKRLATQFEAAYPEESGLISFAETQFWDTSLGEYVETVCGDGDFRAISAAAEWRALIRRHGIEIESARSGEVAAWFPVRLDRLVAHPSGRTWAGAVGKNLYVFVLEGGDDDARSGATDDALTAGSATSGIA